MRSDFTIQKFRGRTMAEALARMRAELGDGAILLHTEMPSSNGLVRRLLRQKFVITAGRGFQVVRADPDTTRMVRKPKTDTTLLAPAPGPSCGPAAAPAPAASGWLAKKYGLDPAAPPAPAAPLKSADLEAPTKADFLHLRALFEEVRCFLKNAGVQPFEPALMGAYTSLTDNQVSETLAREVVARIQRSFSPKLLADREIFRQAIRVTVRDMIRVSGPTTAQPGRCTTVALVGPTGVGKTTTVAKLAAVFALQQHRNVGLITIDTFRIGATRQLQSYAEMMNVDFRKADSPEELGRAVHDFGHKDIVLIDTIGRSPRDRDSLQSLRNYLEAGKPDEVHLVLSVTSSSGSLVEIAESYAECAISKLILAKLDEVSKFGLILDLLAKVQKEVSYLTLGQQVPQDIRPADSDQLAGLILGERDAARSGGRAAPAGA